MTIQMFLFNHSSFNEIIDLWRCWTCTTARSLCHPSSFLRRPFPLCWLSSQLGLHPWPWGRGCHSCGRGRQRTLPKRHPSQQPPLCGQCSCTLPPTETGSSQHARRSWTLAAGDAGKKAIVLRDEKKVKMNIFMWVHTADMLYTLECIFVFIQWKCVRQGCVTMKTMKKPQSREWTPFPSYSFERPRAPRSPWPSFGRSSGWLGSTSYGNAGWSSSSGNCPSTLSCLLKLGQALWSSKLPDWSLMSMLYLWLDILQASSIEEEEEEEDMAAKS